MIAGVPEPKNLFNIGDSCDAKAKSWTAYQENPLLLASHHEWTYFEDDSRVMKLPLDPRPICGGSAYTDVESVSAWGGMDEAGYKGAFGETNWLDGWSIINEPECAPLPLPLPSRIPVPPPPPASPTPPYPTLQVRWLRLIDVRVR